MTERGVKEGGKRRKELEEGKTSHIHLRLNRELETLRPSATDINKLAALMEMTQMCQCGVGLINFNEPNSSGEQKKKREGEV